MADTESIHDEGEGARSVTPLPPAATVSSVGLTPDERRGRAFTGRLGWLIADARLKERAP